MSTELDDRPVGAKMGEVGRTIWVILVVLMVLVGALYTWRVYGPQEIIVEEPQSGEP